jgi:divinyl chlorophyllide a 8-vinyl-reductase
MTKPSARRVLLLGGSGTIGRAVADAIVARGDQAVCVVRPGAAPLPEGALRREADVTDPDALRRDGLRGERFDAVISCLASRTGVPAEAWAIDHKAHSGVLSVARKVGIPRFVLLSAICVQKPRLAFQHAKLAFEAELQASGLIWSIVRPTAYFKSLSGQVARVRAGKPYLLFGDGELTACKPISDRDLAAYMVACLDREDRASRVLPIGGPGPAITPREQGEALFAMLGMEPRFKSVPPGLLRGIGAGLGLAGAVIPALARKAALARIGHYYATESMLVWDEVTGRYDADATPETGSDRLFDYYAKLLAGDATAERGDHAVF